MSPYFLPKGRDAGQGNCSPGGDRKDYVVIAFLSTESDRAGGQHQYRLLYRAGGGYRSRQRIASGAMRWPIAGGVSLQNAAKIGHFIRRSILSSDGIQSTLIKPAGTSFNSGGALVVLKTRSRALADGDHVTTPL